MSGARDHHPFGFPIWMAGGGAKPGLIYGATGEPGDHAVENVRTIHDLHATVFHLLGLDHQNLSNPGIASPGRNFSIGRSSSFCLMESKVRGYIRLAV